MNECRMIDDPDNIDDIEAAKYRRSIAEMFYQEPPWDKWPPSSGLAKKNIAICYAIGRHWNPPESIAPEAKSKEEDYEDLCERVECAISLRHLKFIERNGAERVVVKEFYQWLKDQGDEFYSELHPEFIARNPSLSQNKTNRQRSDSEHESGGALSEFRVMDNLKFIEITLKLGETRSSVIVSARGLTRTVAFSDLGLAKVDNISPNVLATAFWEIARGEFKYQDKTSKRRLADLSATLKSAFGIDDRPFRKGVPRFVVTNPSKVVTTKKAELKTVPFDEQNHSFESDAVEPEPSQPPPEKTGDRWLEENDDEYGKSSSNYLPTDDE
jgi:hypothetical protein